MFASSVLSPLASLCDASDPQTTAFKCKIARDAEEGKTKLSRGILFLTPSFVCFLPSKSPERKVRRHSPLSHLSLSHLSGTRTGPSLARAMPSGRGSGRPRQGVSFKERAELTRKEKHTKHKRQDLLPSRGRRQRESFHRHAQR